MRDAGVLVDPREVIVTHGCVDALQMSLRVLTRPGDLIAAESPTYYGLLQLADLLGLKVIEIARFNTNAAFTFVEKLFGVKSPSELVEVATAHSRMQFETLTAQGKEPGQGVAYLDDGTLIVVEGGTDLRPRDVAPSALLAGVDEHPLVVDRKGPGVHDAERGTASAGLGHGGGQHLRGALGHVDRGNDDRGTSGAHQLIAFDDAAASVVAAHRRPDAPRSRNARGLYRATRARP